MNQRFLIPLLFSTVAAAAATTVTTTVLERGPHSQIVQSVRAAVDEQGKPVSVTNTFTQLQTGLNRWSDDGWVPATEQVERVNGTLVASTPSMFGSNPAEVREGPQKGKRILAEEEDGARALLMALDATQRTKAQTKRLTEFYRAEDKLCLSAVSRPRPKGRGDRSRSYAFSTMRQPPTRQIRRQRNRCLAILLCRAARTFPDLSGGTQWRRRY